MSRQDASQQLLARRANPWTCESLPDDDLILSAQRGDRRGFDELVLRYRDRLFVSIMTTVDCPLMAEDIVQDAFLRAFEHLHAFKLQCGFYTWIYRIAINTRTNHFRKRDRADPPQSLTHDPVDLTSMTSEAPSRTAERKELQSQIREALLRLDDPHRRIIVLREYEKLDYQTIAKILDIKLGTVRSRLARARARLRTELAVYHVEDKRNTVSTRMPAIHDL